MLKGDASFIAESERTITLFDQSFADVFENE